MSSSWNHVAHTLVGTIDELALDHGEEAFHHCVVLTTASVAYAALHPVRSKQWYLREVSIDRVLHRLANNTA